MKILIAYDGSSCAANAIQDLKYAGLPSEDVQATVLSVGEIRVGGERSPFNIEPALSIAAYAIDNVQETLEHAREAAENNAEQGAKAVAKLFPKWETTSCACLHSPATAILEIADSWKPDLIVMGSHGRGIIGRLFLGSVSLRVASEAHTTVRITRSLHQLTNSNAQTLLLAFDGSHGASRVVHKLLKRSWPEGTRLHIVSVIEVSMIATPQFVWLAGSDFGMYQEIIETRMENALHGLEKEMQKHFEHVTSATPIGIANLEILAEAKRVKAGTIFIGSRGLSGFERILIGSVAYNVATHAEQTVEIVR
jgi:nucleotide-binding universal stress UspA family protein